jgi:hypothetical protein
MEDRRYRSGRFLPLLGVFVGGLVYSLLPMEVRRVRLCRPCRNHRNSCRRDIPRSLGIDQPLGDALVAEELLKIKLRND